MGAFSKAIGGGLGAALATIVLMFLPPMTEKQAAAVEFATYTLVTMAAVYIAPANTQKNDEIPPPAGV